MVDSHRKRATPKRPSAAIIYPPKPLYALPDFNYLDIYPTFNHIFSVMYTKAEHQAIQDVPTIMRELSTLSSAHIKTISKTSRVFSSQQSFCPLTHPVECRALTPDNFCCTLKVPMSTSRKWWKDWRFLTVTCRENFAKGSRGFIG